jgi:hypothetical protein
MEIELIIHSIVDTITNSSTEIYTFPSKDAINTVKTIIKTIMKQVGINGEVEDYFDVHFEIDTDSGFKEQLLDRARFEHNFYTVEQINEMFENNDPRLLDEIDEDYNPYLRKLVVRLKDENNSDIGNLFEQIMTTEELAC